MNNLNKIFKFYNIKKNEGIYSYLTFLDILNIKKCSKIMNENTILPPLFNLKINENVKRNEILKMLETKGQYIKKIIFGDYFSTNSDINSILSKCMYVDEISVYNVIICNEFKEAHSKRSIIAGKILERIYLESNIFKNIKKMTAYESEMFDDFKWNEKYIISITEKYRDYPQSVVGVQGPMGSCSENFSYVHYKFREFISHRERQKIKKESFNQINYNKASRKSMRRQFKC